MRNKKLSRFAFAPLVLAYFACADPASVGTSAQALTEEECQSTTGNKVTICHREGNNMDGVTITVAVEGCLRGHAQQHEFDTLGECGAALCVPECTDDWTCCPGYGCAHLDRDELNCGYCGIQCASNATCWEGVCLTPTP
ncbi:MAG: hypothetical protein HYV07_10625 [Deltaproteobacteria bacterium]|nr:hypothetical protein [Deltaproteobacteria bacterium]